MTKKILNVVTVFVVLALMLCTVLSKYISEAMRPAVEAALPTGEVWQIDGEEEPVLLVPDSAVFTVEGTRKCVYVVREQRGLFGDESSLMLADVSVLGQRDGRTAIGGRYVRGNDRVVLNPVEGWEDGMVVRVVNEEKE